MTRLKTMVVPTITASITVMYAVDSDMYCFSQGTTCFNTKGVIVKISQ